MIVLENSKPTREDFKSLMQEVDRVLNERAKTDKKIQTNKGGRDLEPIVYDVVKECAIDTPFNDRISLHEKDGIFPDIVAAQYYGIEVKSTTHNQWTSIGSSIKETTRVNDVERIFLTFGKLGKPIEFLSRPYEDCLSGISVTHYPRYQINMQLKAGETIFDKIGTTYDDLRNEDDPVPKVADYYRSLLKPGESLWWAGNKVEEEIPAKVRLWTALTPTEKDQFESYAYVYFPECIMSKGSKKYSRMVLWLATQKGIINSNVRDSFSAGGQVAMKTEAGLIIKMPAVFNKVKEHLPLFIDTLLNTPNEDLKEFWGVPIQKNRLLQWIDLVVREAGTPNESKVAQSVLKRIFKDQGLM